MVTRRSSSLSNRINDTVNKYFQIIIVFIFMAPLAQVSVEAQTPLDTTLTNLAPEPEVVPPVETTPVITNQFPVITNQIPVVKPKPGTKASGASILNAFSGSLGQTYSVSGRTLKFPAPQPSPRNSDAWRRNLDLGVNRSQGNTDTLRYSLGLNAVKEKEDNTYRFHARGAYGESDGTRDTENAQATARYDRQLTPTLYALGALDWMTDPIAELDYRVTGILSPGVHIVRSKTALLNIEIGAGYIEEKKENDEDGYAAGRAAFAAEKLINDHLLGWASVEYLPKLVDTSVFYINSEIGVASYITRDLSLIICYQDRYDSNPAEDKQASDSIFSTALSLNF